MKRNIFDKTLLCSNRNKRNQFVPGLKYLESREQFIEIKVTAFYPFDFWKLCKVEGLFILVILNRWNVDYYEQQCILYSVTQEKVQIQHFMKNNKTKKKANYKQFLSQRQFSVYYSLDLGKKNRFNMYAGKSEHKQNVCIFLFRIKTLQTAVRRACYPQSLCVSVCLCAVFSKLHDSVSYCWDRRHLCRLGIAGASWDCRVRFIYKVLLANKVYFRVLCLSDVRTQKELRAKWKRETVLKNTQKDWREKTINLC